MCRILSQSSLQWENNKAYLENTCLWECKNNYIPTYIQNRTLRLHGALDLDYNSISLCSGFMGGLHSLQDSIVIKSCYMSTYYYLICFVWYREPRSPEISRIFSWCQCIHAWHQVKQHDLVAWPIICVWMDWPITSTASSLPLII